MRFVIFCHSLISDWNHGNAHFLRGVITELIERGHEARVYEPRDAWSVQHLVRDHGEAPIAAFRRAYPKLHSTRYDAARFDPAEALDGADVVLVHEWNDPRLVARIGLVKAAGGRFRLFFHDTHHRAATAPGEMARYDLRHFDGVLAFGDAIRDLYLERGWAQRAWTWHEAADIRVFRPRTHGGDEEGAGVIPDGDGAAARVGEGSRDQPAGDLIWIGNWGDEERTAELRRFLIEPARALRLRTTIYGVRYPEDALRRLRRAGIDYRGWLPNFQVPAAFARHRVTVHIPRRPYARALPGIPTIRPFEALACGIPLVSAPWDDVEQLFTPGADYLVARNGREMRRHLRDVLHDRALAESLVEHGRRTILDRHTCAHRVDQLLRICAALGPARKELIVT